MLNTDFSADRAVPVAASVVPSPSAYAARGAHPDSMVQAEAERVRASIETELEHVAVLGYN